MKKFNYCVAHYWNDEKTSIGAYLCGSEVHYGTLKEAKDHLKYVKRQSPDEKWKIFMVSELPD